MRTVVGIRMLMVLAFFARSAYAFSPTDVTNPPDDNIAERLILKSGDILTGRSVETDGGWLIWLSPEGETLQIPLDQIERLETGPPAEEEVVVPPSPTLTDPQKVVGEQDPYQWADSMPYTKSLLQNYGVSRDVVARWTQRVSIGGQFNQGNTKTDLIDVAAVFEQNTKERMRQIDGGGQWGANAGKQTANRWWLNSNFDWPVEDKWIAFVTSKNEYNDPAHLNYRGTLSAGTGYRFIFEDKRRFIVRFGPAYTLEIFRGPSHTRQTPDLFAEVESIWPLGTRASLEQKMRVQPSMMNIELVRVFSTTGVLVNLDEKDRWKLRLGFQFQYISIPNTGRLPSDYMTTLSLVYTRK